MKNSKLLLFIIILIAAFLRFYNLGTVPAGIHPDEESHGYNAFSLFETGKDRYGESFPILFRSFGSYQPPLYTYLAVLPVKLMGNTIFSIRSVSAVAGLGLVLITYLVALKIFDPKYRYQLALISALVIAISPWSIYFNRLTAEGSLGVTVFALSVLLFILSLKKIVYFPIACLVLGLSTHAYYSERVISILFLPIFIFVFRSHFSKARRSWILAGLSIFALSMVPHLMIASSGALTRRLVQVGNPSTSSLISQFINKYIIYFSPSNLFFNTGEDLGRISPQMGVYYSLFIIPFFVGIRFAKKYILPEYLKLLIVLIILTPVSAAMTGDSYYPLRALDLIWLLSLFISLGIFNILNILPRKIGWAILGIAVLHSLFAFYISYFVLFKYERAANYGNSYIVLQEKLKDYSKYRIIIDSSREYGAGLRIAYLNKYNPLDLQKQLKSQLNSPYYSSSVALLENYEIGNIKIQPLSWSTACQKDTLIVGDMISISDVQAKEHDLIPAFTIEDKTGATVLRAYLTNNNSKSCSQ